MASSGFRVVIAGGGPVGLVTAHALMAAGIDFVLLERRPEVVDDGGATFVFPQNVRVLDQLGLLDPAPHLKTDFKSKCETLLNGRETCTFPAMRILEEQFGYPIYVATRQEWLAILWEGLSKRARENIRTGCNIQDIESTTTGVRVTLADGSVEEGSILIGCDGVRSKARDAIQQLDARETSNEDENPVPTAHFSCLVGSCPFPGGVDRQIFYEAHGTDKATQFVATADKVCFTAYRRRAKPTTEYHQYSPEETEAYAKEFEDVVVAPGIKFGQIWRQRGWARLVDQEEGMAETWHHGRIVLLGDSALKVTSVSGLGLNAGISSCVYLVNGLHVLLQETGGKPPSLDAIDRVFADYQAIRKPESQSVYAYAVEDMRRSTFESWKLWFQDQWMIPLLHNENFFMKMYGTPLVNRAGRVFNFLSKERLREGKTPWMYQ